MTKMNPQPESGPAMDEEGGLDAGSARTLLDTARRAIASRLSGADDAPPGVPASSPLAARRATFVTLRRDGQLRGCIGSLEADLPLIESVWQNARRAAFDDPRFAPLTEDETADLEIHVSVLSPLVPMVVDSEADLVAQLRPGVDGLVIEDGRRRATFLPDVWESLPEPGVFLEQLKLKAGLPADRESSTLRAWTYRTHGYG